MARNGGCSGWPGPVLLGYMQGFILCGVLLWMKSSVSPYMDSLLVKYFPSCLSGMLGLPCPLFALENLPATGRMYFWLALCPVDSR